MTRLVRSTLAVLALAPLVAWGAGAELHLDKAPDRSRDTAALQNGAKIFVNYCLNCHGASDRRYNRLRDIGLTEEQIKGNLMFAADKIGELMKVAIDPREAKQWFGAAPPDLTVIARSRASEFGSGADWLYTYLRTFYRDPGRPTGWNNTVFENVGMPHALWDLQGIQVAHIEEKLDGHGNKVQHKTLKLETPGKLSQAEYDRVVADLVGFLVYMGEPAADTRKRVGIVVLVALGILAVLSYLLKREFWKDIH